MSNQQRIIWPWERRNWTEVKQKICDKIGSVVEMDSRIASIHSGKFRPRQMSELFNMYYNDNQYEKDRIPEKVVIDNIIPHMQQLIEGAPKLFRGFKSYALVPTISTNIAFTRPQVATILAGIWFGIFNYDYLSPGLYKIEDFPEPSFLHMFASQNIFAFQCLINYFARVYQYMTNSDELIRMSFDAGNIILKRNVLVDHPPWDSSNVAITKIFIGEDNVDDSPAKMHTAYAHEFIGGDLFKNTPTQEEIILLVRPECLVATLFCGRLEHNETLTVIGAEKLSQYHGYGSSVKFIGNFIDSVIKGYSSDETEIMAQCATIFMDASPKTSGVSQFVAEFMRDLNKAYCGFDSLQFTSAIQIASGHWSYGFNGGNMQVKFIQQLLAASQSGKYFIYHPFNRDFEDRMLPFVEWLQTNNLTVGQLFTRYITLMKQCYTGPNSRFNDLDIFECLRDY